jgi:hypothetical protein
MAKNLICSEHQRRNNRRKLRRKIDGTHRHRPVLFVVSEAESESESPHRRTRSSAGFHRKIENSTSHPSPSPVPRRPSPVTVTVARTRHRHPSSVTRVSDGVGVGVRVGVSHIENSPHLRVFTTSSRTRFAPVARPRPPHPSPVPVTSSSPVTGFRVSVRVVWREPLEKPSSGGLSPQNRESIGAVVRPRRPSPSSVSVRSLSRSRVGQTCIENHSLRVFHCKIKIVRSHFF